MSFYSINEYEYSGSQQFQVSFVLGYISRDHVKAYIVRDGTEISVPFDWINDNTIAIDGTILNTDLVRIKRVVPKSSLVSDITAPGKATRENLELTVLQSIMIGHEYLDGQGQDLVIGPTLTDDIAAGLEFIANNIDAFTNLGAFSPEDVSALGDFVASIAEVRSVLFDGIRTNFPEGTAFSLTGYQLDGTISRLIELSALDEYDRPAITWLDEDERMRAAMYYHTLNAADDNLHAALEIKTSGPPDAVNPYNMITRFAIDTDGDDVNAEFYKIKVLQFATDDRTALRFVNENDGTNTDIVQVNPVTNETGYITFSGERAKVGYSFEESSLQVVAGSGKNIQMFIDGKSAPELEMFSDGSTRLASTLLQLNRETNASTAVQMSFDRATFGYNFDNGMAYMGGGSGKGVAIYTNGRSGTDWDVVINASGTTARSVRLAGTIQPKLYSAGSLPTPSSEWLGHRAFATNVDGVAFNAIVVPGGSEVTPVFCDGVNWRCG